MAARLPIINRLDKTQLYKIVCYLFIGGVVYIANTAALTVTRRAFYLSDVAAITVSFILATVLHFVLHNFITFKNSTRALLSRMVGHFSIACLNYVIALAVSYTVINYIYDSNILATAASTGTTMVIGFLLLNRLYTKNANNKE